MARVWKIESMQIKDVIKESYHPDATFRHNAVIKVSGTPQIIPIEFAILRIHATLWRVREQWTFTRLFIPLYRELKSAEELAKLHRSRPDVINWRIEKMLDSAITSMSQRDADFILNIYDDFMKITAKCQI